MGELLAGDPQTCGRERGLAHRARVAPIFPLKPIPRSTIESAAAAADSSTTIKELAKLFDRSTATPAGVNASRAAESRPASPPTNRDTITTANRPSITNLALNGSRMAIGGLSNETTPAEPNELNSQRGQCIILRAPAA